jgi:hypothetical protein
VGVPPPPRRHAARCRGKTVIPLLIFDQFEEIFTLGQGNDAGRQRAAEFIEDLADLVENRPPRALEARLESDDTIPERFDFSRADYRILIALREDYLAHLEGLKGVMPSITQNRMRLARMNGQQALAAVLKPGGRLVSEEVAESIVRFVAGGAELRNAEVEPSLLSLICRELNNARIAQGRNEISADLLAGSRDTILNEFYERALADQPPAVRKIIEDELLTESGFRESLAEERLHQGVRRRRRAPGRARDAGQPAPAAHRGTPRRAPRGTHPRRALRRRARQPRPAARARGARRGRAPARSAARARGRDAQGAQAGPADRRRLRGAGGGRGRQRDLRLPEHEAGAEG